MKRAAFLVLFACLSAALAPACTATDVSCPTSLQGVAAFFTAPKVPIDSKSGCSGYSSVPFQGEIQGESFPAAPAPLCYVSTSDDACDSCLGLECCYTVNSTCSADATGAACAALPAVSSCFTGALAGACAVACNPGDAGSGGRGS